MRNVYEESKSFKIFIDAVLDSSRLIQLFPYGETNQEHCVHGIKLRWSCDDCDAFSESKAQKEDKP